MAGARRDRRLAGVAPNPLPMREALATFEKPSKVQRAAAVETAHVLTGRPDLAKRPRRHRYALTTEKNMLGAKGRTYWY
jgi:hypothetical protein